MIGGIEAVYDDRHAAVALEDVATERVGHGAKAGVERGCVALGRLRAYRAFVSSSCVVIVSPVEDASPGGGTRRFAPLPQDLPQPLFHPRAHPARLPVIRSRMNSATGLASGPLSPTGPTQVGHP